jgi:replicative DNA helicase
MTENESFAPLDPSIAQLRVPPHSIESESSVLGGLLLSGAAWDRVSDLLVDTDFYSSDHRLIFTAIAALANANKEIDVITVFEQLQGIGKAEEIGGLAYLSSLSQYVPSASNIRRYAEIVRERSILRKLVGASDEIATAAFNTEGKPVKDILDDAEQKILNIGEQTGRLRQGFLSINDVVVTCIDRIEALADNPDAFNGLPTGFYDLDRMTLGLQAGDLIILAARPSVGKTALAINIAEHVALVEQKPVAVFSMEMGSAQLGIRLIGSVGRIDQTHLRTGKLTDDEWPRLTEAIEKLRGAPLHIEETAGIGISELRAAARRLARQTGGLGLIVVDYIQLMSISAGMSGENRATAVGELSRGLKMLAKELGCPVIALSQLSRKVEERPDKRPMMSDLRECVTGDTLVTLTDGSRTPIAELVGQSQEVWAVDCNQKLLPAMAEAAWPVGEREVFQATLASGRRIRATAQHKMLTGSGWVELGSINPGDRMALSRFTPKPQTPSSWPDHEVILLAHLIGDGSYLTNQPLRYTKGCEHNLGIVTECATKMGSSVKRYPGSGNWAQLVIAGNGNRWRPAGVGAWIKGLGIWNQRSHEKRIPPAAFQLSNAQLSLFLRHLWSTDGCVRGGVHYSTSSRRLADDVAALLMRFGIIARIVRVPQKAGRDNWLVIVSGAVDQLNFIDRVGTFGRIEAPAQELRQRLLQIKPNTNVDTMPDQVFEIVRREMLKGGISQRAMAAARGTAYGGASHFKFAPSRVITAEYAVLLNNPELQAWADSDIFWDRVVSIEPAGTEPVFDLTVPGPANWLADGIVTHNSGALEQDADVILFIYRDDFYNQDSKEPGIAEIIISKQRNGPTGTVKLAFIKPLTKFESLATGSFDH